MFLSTVHVQFWIMGGINTREPGRNNHQQILLSYQPVLFLFSTVICTDSGDIAWTAYLQHFYSNSFICWWCWTVGCCTMCWCGLTPWEMSLLVYLRCESRCSLETAFQLLICWQWLAVRPPQPATTRHYPALRLSVRPAGPGQQQFLPGSTREYYQRVTA